MVHIMRTGTTIYVALGLCVWVIDVFALSLYATYFVGMMGIIIFEFFFYEFIDCISNS